MAACRAVIRPSWGGAGLEVKRDADDDGAVVGCESLADLHACDAQ